MVELEYTRLSKSCVLVTCQFKSDQVHLCLLGGMEDTVGLGPAIERCTRSNRVAGTLNINKIKRRVIVYERL